ncbi:MAG TPA: NADPH-dependent FMN reductase [Puia sp.]|jgi:NAD(P)H-dependent FMN reductase|nr:NADPH-dependent FMN reductase [Puia sp.]
MPRPTILALSGSTRQTSVNKAILDFIRTTYATNYDIIIYEKLSDLPYFNPDNTDPEHLPAIVREFLSLIENAAGVIICTPEYVFSLPGILKNAIEWTVATTVFQDKPLAMIVASLSGQKAFESLDLIMNTVGAKMTPMSKLLITGAYSKLNKASHTLDEMTLNLLKDLMLFFQELVPQP